MAEDLLSDVLKSDTGFDEDEQIDYLKNLKSDEDIAAAKALLEEEAEEDDRTAAAETLKSQSEKKEPEKETPETKEDAKKDEVKPEIKDEVKKADEPAAAATSTAGLDLNQIVTDEVINQFEEKDRKILSKYKGKPVKDYLNALIHSQREIGKRQNPLKPEVVKTEQPQQINKQEQIQKVVETESDRRLKELYPNMPQKGTPEYKEWLKDFQDDDPDKYDDFIMDRRQIKIQVQKDMDELIHTAENRGSINTKNLQQNIDIIKQRLSESGVDDPAKIGYDFEIKYEEDGTPYCDDLNEILFDENGKPDFRLFKTVGNIPIIRESALAQKFLFEKQPEIVQKILSTHAQKAIEQHEELKKKAPIPVSGSSSKAASEGARFDLSKIETVTDDRAIKSALSALEQEILNNPEE